MPTPDVLGAVYDFLQAYILPADTPIVRGWINRAALPDNTSYAVLTLINEARQGTNVHRWLPAPDDEPGRMINSVRMLARHEVQVDFCGLDEETVSAQARTLAILGRDDVAVKFFGGHGLSCLYADDPRSLPFTSDANQWEVRYSVTLHLSGWSAADIQQDAFDEVDIYLENVDVHHKITGD